MTGCAHNHQIASAASITANLLSHHWKLIQAWNAQGQPDDRWQAPATKQGQRAIGLRFQDNQLLSIDRICNVMGGRYAVDGNALKLDKLVSTMMACSDPKLTEMERNVAATLGQAQRWQITQATPPVLEIAFANGGKWRLQGTPTYETLYGNSERVFWEIAPKTVSCQHPLMGEKQCLQVREVTYDQNYLKQTPGPWQAFYGDIEGYQHQAGVRNVLRLKRYTKPQPAADTSRYVYVLDMAVESEVIR
ncbi:MAG: DUF4377 domain-containing protein [Comamonas sp.]